MTVTTPPPLAGISHLGFSVPDLEAAAAFWVDVLGFEVTTRMPGLVFVVHRAARIAVGLTDHGGQVEGPVTPTRPGLDHLALAVPGLVELEGWAARLDELGVDNSGITPTDAGHHLNLHGPNGFPVELFVLSAAAAAGFGLGSADEGFARPPG